MRSQLDCYDHRLPGSGTFDIKTRAAVVIRHDRANYEVSLWQLQHIRVCYQVNNDSFDLCRRKTARMTSTS
jgi:hypothetical protein